MNKKSAYMVIAGMLALVALVAYLWRGWDGVLFVLIFGGVGSLAGLVRAHFRKRDDDRQRQRFEDEGYFANGDS